VKKVYLAENPIAAHMVVDMLEAAGIPAQVQGEHLFAIRGALPVSYPTVWVLDEDDYQRARELALAYDKGAASASAKPAFEPWTCTQCGERIEGQFGLCWQCGAERPLEGDGSE
jgi:hypothetical protein